MTAPMAAPSKAAGLGLVVEALRDFAGFWAKMRKAPHEARPFF